MASVVGKLVTLRDSLQSMEMTKNAWHRLKGYRVVTIGSLVAFLLGYMGTWAPPGSFIFLCVFVSLVAVTQHAEYKKHVIIKSRQYIAQNEMAEVQRRLRDIPSWVHFPEQEKAEWLNKVLKKLWPFVNRYVEDFLRQQVEPQVKEQLPSILSGGFKFGPISLGKQSPRVANVQTFVTERHTAHGGREREIIADVDWVYPGDCNIQMILTRIPTAGIQDLRISGNLRVVMTPLLSKPPFIGAVTFFFKEPPSLNFNFTNAANLFDLPGMSEALRGLVRDQIDCRFTLPNRMVIPLCNEPEVDTVALKFPIPEGILRIGMIEAKDLVEKDITGKSDPYAVLKIGAIKFTTKTIPRSLNPTWNEFFEAPVFYVQGQTLSIHLFDSDKTTADEAMGNASIGVKQYTLTANGFLEKWVSLTDAASGKIHVLGSYLHLSDNPNDLRAAFQAQRLMPFEANNLNVAYLKLTVLGAKNLPKSRDSRGNFDREDRPSPLVRVTRAGHGVEKGKRHMTKVVVNSRDPTWQDGFDFFLSNPETEQIEFEVLDEQKSKKIISTVSLSVSEIMKASQMRDSFELELDNKDAKYGFYSRSPSILKIRAALRFLVAGGLERQTSKDLSGFDFEAPSCSRDKSDYTSDDSGIGRHQPRSDSERRGTTSVPQTPLSSTGQNRKFGKNESPTKSRNMSSLERRKTMDAKNRNNVGGEGVMAPTLMRRQPSLSAISIGEPDESEPVINLGFNFNQLKNQLTVGVNEAKNLSSLFKTSPNCYVTVLLKSSKPKQEQSETTEIIENSDRPRWYKPMIFNTTLEILDNSTLLVSLYNQNEKKPNGYVKLDLKELDIESRSFWFPIKDSPKFVAPIEIKPNE